MEKKPISTIVVGAIICLLMIIYTLILNLNNLQGNSQLSWISYIIVIAGICFFVVKYGKDRLGKVTFGNLFAYGFKSTAALIIFFIVFIIIFYLLFPEYKQQMLDIVKEKAMEKATAENRENIEKGVDMFSKFFWVGLIAGSMFSFALLGAIGSLIGAAVTKKDPNFHQQIDQIK